MATERKRSDDEALGSPADPRIAPGRDPMIGTVPDLRRHPRMNVSWPVVVRTKEHVFHIETVNVSARGAKVRLKEPLEVGTLAQLHFKPPDDRPRNLSAIVWRVDPDGLVFFFIDEMPLDQAQMSRSPA